MDITKPSLIEPGVKYYFNGVLKQCNAIREQYINTIFNISLFAILLLILGSILYFKYKGKLTPEEKEAKKRKEQEYILSKLSKVNAMNYAANKGKSITGLPFWDPPIVPQHKLY